ncbi:MAG: epoxyqueuosine reductase QueH [Candidatus Omnitrophica bacterium]|nr:epoxyqueuosine reductase QueH [Candidatus Omnitrophota bacterium]MCM8822773.1 epoxyqueuosine reductase QueH [Candidatus Omnitrophota bacterium]MCM8824811.1 epoxyqueuosine reductase QueH [Candidatus Omnitrophota bacterium]MCM8828591.1 epoxyqueuosine reductase QueH [Candidatus Omnitrophota bacterium]
MKEKILIHVCCGICAIKTIEFLRAEYQIVGYWYNPNIQPYAEYRMRVQTAGYVFQRSGEKIEWNLNYDVIDWLNLTLSVAKDKARRCAICYEMRLEAAAQFARNAGIKIFTTTMFSSIHQDIETIKKKGVSIAKKHNLQFLPLDLRQYQQETKNIALKWHLYRQRYCGCLFSELERENIK